MFRSDVHDADSDDRQLLSSFLHFPIDLVRTFSLPVSSTNLYITRVDVTFDTFRVSALRVPRVNSY